MFGWDDDRQCRLVCQWHALRSLRKAIFGESKAYEHLRVEPTNPAHDADALRRQVMDLLVQMSKTDSKDDYQNVLLLLRQYIGTGSARFMKHLEAHYLSRPEQWSRAWRLLPDGYAALVTSMHAEASFRVIKHKYLKGLANRRLDVLVYALLKFAADQVTAMLTMAARPTYTRIESTIAKTHRVNAKIYFDEQSMITQTTSTHWKVKSANKDFAHMHYDVSALSI